MNIDELQKARQLIKQQEKEAKDDKTKLIPLDREYQLTVDELYDLYLSVKKHNK